MLGLKPGDLGFKGREAVVRWHSVPFLVARESGLGGTTATEFRRFIVPFHSIWNEMATECIKQKTLYSHLRLSLVGASGTCREGHEERVKFNNSIA